MKSLRIAFMGTPDFALSVLKGLMQSSHEIICVYSQPPRPKGRGHKEQRSPVHVYADDAGLPVFTPLNFKSEEERGRFRNFDLDVAVVAAYGLILPQAILDAPRYGCLNVHASLLPRWRGASPIQQTIWHGDQESGVTIMQMEKGLDSGPMILKGSLPLTEQITASCLHDELAEMGAKLAVQALDVLAKEGKLESEIQNEEEVTYAPLLQKEDGQINWQQSAEQIDRQIRALNPWPGVWTVFEGERVKILEAHKTGETTDQPEGLILNKEGKVACGRGSVLQVIRVQPAGAKSMDFKSAINGGYLKNGSFLSQDQLQN